MNDLAFAQANVNSVGRIFIGAFAASKLQIIEPDFQFTAEKIAITDLYLPGISRRSNSASELASSLYTSAEMLGLVFQDRHTGQSLPIERFTVTFDSDNDDFPISASIQVSNIVLSQSMFPPSQQSLLDGLGLRQVEANINFEGVWDGELGAVNIPTAEVALKNLFTLQLSLELNGLTDTVVDQSFELASKDNVIALDLLQGVAISNLTLSLIDEGGLDQMIIQQARLNGLSRRAYVKQLTEKAERQFKQIPERSKQLEFTEALYSFLQNPESISLSVAPRSPVNTAQILGVTALSPLSLVSLLGITMEANVD